MVSSMRLLKVSLPFQGLLGLQSHSQEGEDCPRNKRMYVRASALVNASWGNFSPQELRDVAQSAHKRAVLPTYCRNWYRKECEFTRNTYFPIIVSENSRLCMLIYFVCYLITVYYFHLILFNHRIACFRMEDY